MALSWFVQITDSVVPGFLYLWCLTHPNLATRHTTVCFDVDTLMLFTHRKLNVAKLENAAICTYACIHGSSDALTIYIE